MTAIWGDIVTAVDFAVLAFFLPYGLVCWHLGISHRISILAGLLLILASAILVGSGLPAAGDFAAVLAFWFLLVGALLSVIGGRSDSRKKAPTTDENP